MSSMDYSYLSEDDQIALIENRIRTLERQHFDNELFRTVALISIAEDDIAGQLSLANTLDKQDKIKEAIGVLAAMKNDLLANA